MNLLRILTLCSLAGLLLCGCGRSTRPAAPSADTLALRHASLLTIARTDSYTVADVHDPWHAGQLLHRYILVPRSQPLPHRRPAGTVVRTPLRRAVVASAVHAALLADLGRAGAICGVCDTAYIVSPAIRSALADGRLDAMGSSMQPDAERIAAVRADALLLSPYDGADYGAAARLGIPVIECADYMETSALGRAEWMRFYGLLFGCAAQADSLFAATERRYTALSRRALQATGRPALLTDRKEGQAWYVPGGRSYLGRLYADAGARYLFADRTESGSVALAPETVMAEAADADVWLIKYGAAADLTYEALRRDVPAYARFRPWRERHIYACNTLRTPFYEQVPFHPDLLLADVAALLHPEAFPGHRPVFFFPLAEP